MEKEEVEEDEDQRERRKERGEGRGRTFIVHLLRAQQYSNCFTYTNSFNPHKAKQNKQKKQQPKLWSLCYYPHFIDKETETQNIFTSTK